MKLVSVSYRGKYFCINMDVVTRIYRDPDGETTLATLDGERYNIDEDYDDFLHRFGDELWID